jgi:hypothetical protein
MSASLEKGGAEGTTAPLAVVPAAPSASPSAEAAEPKKNAAAEKSEHLRSAYETVSAHTCAPLCVLRLLSRAPSFGSPGSSPLSLSLRACCPLPLRRHI